MGFGLGRAERMLYLCLQIMKTIISQHIKNLGLSALLAFGGAFHAAAQDIVQPSSARNDWYVQMGLDLTLQNPYGSPEGSTLTEGRSSGIVVSVGHWFTPTLGLRLRGNWDNGFAPLSNKKAAWLAFPDPTHINAEHGGFMSVTGDVQFDLKQLFFPTLGSDKWRLLLYPRAGVAFNFSLNKGAPLLGVGVGGVLRLNKRCGLFADATYQMVSSGFNGCGTDIGSGANAYFDVTAGVQINLNRRSSKTNHHDNKPAL